MTVITCIEDFRPLYRRRVPRMFYDYTESGSWTEQTFRENASDFARLYLRQRVAVDMAGRSVATEMAGEPAALPVALAPVGMLGMQHPDGEIAAARAAAAFGVPFTLSTMSIGSIEDVAAATARPFWFQLYTMKDEGFLADLVARAKAARCSALVITLDLQIVGQRHKDIRNGLSAPPKPTPRMVLDLMTRWRWGAGMLRAKRWHFGNIVGHAPGSAGRAGDPARMMEWIGEQFDLTLDWDKIARIRAMWGGRVILKGILDPEDARRAVAVGADAIVVSNHGGRQLDGALSTIRALGPVLDAVGGETEVHVDGGIRSGQDVLKAVAMGARGAWIGRAYVHALGALGGPGVTRALEVIRKELDVSMALCGHRDIRAVGRDVLLVPEGFSGRWEA